MRILVFSKRNLKEILRDPLSVAFCIGLPLFLLFLISMIQKSTSVPIFEIQNFAPGIAIFSFSFITLFSSNLISKDRNTSFLMRLFSSPLKAYEYILGYTLPLVLIAFLQSVLCFICAILLGLEFNINVIYSLFALLPISLLFIFFGLLFGSIFNDKQTAGITSIYIQIAALSSGMWFDLNLIGGAIKTIAYLLPFAHSLDIIKGILIGDFTGLLPHIIWVVGYIIVVSFLAIKVFKNKMTSGEI